MRIRATIFHDEWAEDPNGMEGWTLHSFSPRHASYTPYEYFLDGGRFAGEAVYGLSYYEHGTGEWNVAGDPFEAGKGPGGYRNFDFTPVAGVLTWDSETPLAEIWADEAGIRLSAEAFADEYTAWMNGDVYIVNFYEVTGCSECGSEQLEALDATSVTGYDEAVAEAREYAASTLGEPLTDANFELDTDF